MKPTTNDSVFSYNIPSGENQHSIFKDSGSLQQGRYLDFGNLNSTTIGMPLNTHSISNDGDVVTERKKKRKNTNSETIHSGDKKEPKKKKFKFIDASSSFYPTEDTPPQLPRIQTHQPNSVDNSPVGHGYMYPSSFFLPPSNIYGRDTTNHFNNYSTGALPFNPYSNRPATENEFNRFDSRNLIRRGENATEAFRKSMASSRSMIQENTNVQPTMRTNRIQIATDIVHQNHRSPTQRGVVVSTENSFQIHGIFNQVNVFIETSDNRISTRVEAIITNPNRHSIALNINNYLTMRGPMMNARFMDNRVRHPENSGLSRESLNNLTSFKFDNQSSLDSCSICLESFKKGEDVTSLPCAHGYHKDCIYEWMSRKNACPMCRSSV